MISEFLPEWTDGRISFTVGTGRCGTTFLYRLLDREKKVAASHERNPLLETFHRFAKWHGLPIDDEGFHESKAREIAIDLQSNQFSAEASAYLSFSIRELHERFGARFVLLVRNPEDVIRSYLAKGWYDRPVSYRDRSLVPGYQECEHFHHFLGRPIPQGEEFEEWNQLTRAGKLAWFWATVNRSVVEKFDQLPPDTTRVQKLEYLDFETYLDLGRFLGFESEISRRTFERMVRGKPNKSRIPIARRDWTPLERSEISKQACDTATSFGYSLFGDKTQLP
ncbi:MAG: hypothetical protein ACSHX9_01995 [Luteolibacter sp.]